MQAGDLVRLVDNPSRLGTLTAQRSGVAPRERVLVNFNDGKRELQLVSALELVGLDGHVEDANDLMLRGMYGRAMDLRGAITHHRLSGKLANLIYSLNTTNTEFLPYQFKPVLHFLESPSNGILIADEVGLGKTIEAGLIWTELRARQDAKRLLVVCPAMLKPKWVAELSNRFGVQAQDVDAATLLKRLEDAKENPSHGFALVASLQGLRAPRGWDSDAEPPKSAAAKLSQFLYEMGAEPPMIDLVVVDEAHYLRNEATQTNKFAQLLRAVTQSLVLLSATPIQTSSKDLFNLLHLLDEDAFPFQASYEWNINANAPIVALRDEILRGTTVTPEKFTAVMDQAKAWFRQSEQIHHLRENPPTQEQLVSPRSRAELADVLDRINPLAKVVSRTLKRDVQEFRVERVVKLLSVTLTSAERMYYEQVTDAVAEMCEMQDVSTGFQLTIPQRQMVSSMVAACRGWKKKLQASIEAARIDDFDEGVEELGIEDAIEVLNDRLVGFLALVIRRCRAWLFAKHAGTLANRTILWKLVLGRAVDRARSDQVGNLMSSILHAAWMVAGGVGEVNRGACGRELSKHRFGKGAGDPCVEVSVVPELAAQIYGFVQSRQFDPRAKNFYLFVDVGAGTVDVSLFRVKPNEYGTWDFSLFSSIVEPNGAMNLHRARLDWWQQQLSTLPGTQGEELLKAIDIFKSPTEQTLPIPEKYTGYFKGVSVGYSGGSLSPDEMFYRNRLVAQVRGQAIHRTVQQKIVGKIDLDELPFFLCGGGARHQLYSAIGSELDNAPDFKWLKAHRRELGIPSELEAPGLAQIDYDRLSVAFGLSFVDVGTVAIAKAMKSLGRRSNIDWRAGYTDKDLC